MLNNKVTGILNGFRIGLVILAAVVSVGTMYYLATLNSPPPNSDGFAYGMAGAIGGGILFLVLGIATLSIIVPTLLGREDPLGFNRWQRLSMKVTGGLIGLGIVAALLGGLNGVVLLLGLLILAYCIVCVMLLWRGAEFVSERRTVASK
jgi:peptidoglycan/LPS O-acetylase OafA/YrhL